VNNEHIETRNTGKTRKGIEPRKTPPLLRKRMTKRENYRSSKKRGKATLTHQLAEVIRRASHQICKERIPGE